MELGRFQRKKETAVEPTYINGVPHLRNEYGVYDPVEVLTETTVLPAIEETSMDEYEVQGLAKEKRAKRRVTKLAVGALTVSALASGSFAAGHIGTNFAGVWISERVSGDKDITWDMYVGDLMETVTEIKENF